MRANCICPGYIDTPMFAEAMGGDGESREARQHNIPLRRLGAPADIARTARFLLSDDAAYITGQTLFVDGGLTLFPSFETTWSSE